jgi:dethiobiotin synthetase
MTHVWAATMSGALRADAQDSSGDRGHSSPAVVLTTGTDTGVGKTWATAALARAVSSTGRRVVAIKPFETGCGAEAGAAEDGVVLARASGQSAPLRALVRLATPVAAPEAADREGVRVDYDAVVREIRGLLVGADLALVEGAGGLLSPLTWERTALDLARDLGARLLVVAVDRLGTVNHTLMTLKLLAASDLHTLGVVLTAPEHPDASTGSNGRAIARLASVRVHSVPRTLDAEASARAMTEVLPWLALP